MRFGGAPSCRTPPSVVSAGAGVSLSSHSNDQGGQCVEGARPGGRVMAVRDSGDPGRGVRVFPAAAWRAFVDEVRSGDSVA
ncbi:DUF397 domain-containing protein [Streptomyces sp. NPDC059118]|uniref:DUF397 domain-containing protein n=1 Tax=unclassified Streptomyces TaxID=2593676 RepID=UPI00368054EC